MVESKTPDPLTRSVREHTFVSMGQRTIFLLSAGVLALAFSCSAPAPADLGFDAEGLVSYTKNTQAMQAFVRQGSLPALGFLFDPRVLAASGYGSWREDALDRIRGIRARGLAFDTLLVPGGAADRQSGLLILPLGAEGEDMEVDWVIWTKATELDTREVPSQGRGSEVVLAEVLAGLGYAVWMPDYAGMGLSPGVQTYGVPDSQALSALDGLGAARKAMEALAAGQGPGYRESGRLHVLGYSQGGQAAMATARLVDREADRAPGLSLARVYAMGAPFDLMVGTRLKANPDLVIQRPEYTLYLVLGWARALPERINPRTLLRPEVEALSRDLFTSGRNAETIHRDLLRGLGKPQGGVNYRDLFLEEHLDRLEKDPTTDPYWQVQDEARLDRTLLAPGVKLILAHSPRDRVVSPRNTASLRDHWIASGRGDQLRFLELATADHAKAGAEALLWAVADLSGRGGD